jgi:hypothetical protein
LFLTLVDTSHEVSGHVLERRARLLIERTKVRPTTLGAAASSRRAPGARSLRRHRGILGEGPLAPLSGDGFAPSGELLLGHDLRIVTQLTVDGRDLDPLGLGSEKLPLEPLDLGLKALGACRLLGILLGQPALEVDDEGLLRRDQRQLLRDDLAELTLALPAGTQLPLKLRDTKVSRVRRALRLCRITCLMESTSWTRTSEGEDKVENGRTGLTRRRRGASARGGSHRAGRFTCETSIPSSSIASSVASSLAVRVPAATLGMRNRPFSNRL